MLIHFQYQSISTKKLGPKTTKLSYGLFLILDYWYIFSSTKVNLVLFNDTPRQDYIFELCYYICCIYCVSFIFLFTQVCITSGKCDDQQNLSVCR